MGFNLGQRPKPYANKGIKFRWNSIKVKEKCESNDAWSQENPTQNHKTLNIKSTLA